MNTCEKLIEDLSKIQRLVPGDYRMNPAPGGRYVAVDNMMEVVARWAAAKADEKAE